MNPKKPNILYKPVSEELNIDKELVEDLVEYYYKEVRLKLSNLEFPRINIDGLGQFVVKPKMVRNNIEKYSKVLQIHDTSTYNAYFHKKILETKLDLLISLEKKISEQELIKNNFKKDKDESSSKSNMGE
jgi:nucleoid DNA-binding protein